MKKGYYKIKVIFDGIKKRQRKTKRHIDLIYTQDEKPNADRMNELERIAKAWIETNYREHSKTFRLEAQYFETDGMFETRLLLGHANDVKQICLF